MNQAQSNVLTYLNQSVSDIQTALSFMQTNRSAIADHNAPSILVDVDATITALQGLSTFVAKLQEHAADVSEISQIA